MIDQRKKCENQISHVPLVVRIPNLMFRTGHGGGHVLASNADEAVYESVLEAWEGTNLVRGNRRKTLLAKLDKKKPNLGGYFPSLDLLAALDPHEKRPH